MRPWPLQSVRVVEGAYILYGTVRDGVGHDTPLMSRSSSTSSRLAVALYKAAKLHFRCVATAGSFLAGYSEIST